MKRSIDIFRHRRHVMLLLLLQYNIEPDPNTIANSRKGYNNINTE